ncbi:hypothetical protein [Lacticaseibacillus paracasei]|uniref:hypothetical protein n=1 Tax=Lacticaseibacillus paracasei TaxID=1597 RepID=UPI00058CBBC4|nr:hypothetical protein [Lacticaseibacillus paracasei]ALX88128.1 hypothetical protein AWC33_02530 [Lacticaseibacillus paracasei]
MIKTPEAKLFDLRLAAYERISSMVMIELSTNTSPLHCMQVAQWSVPKLVYYGIKAYAFYDRTAKFDDQQDRFLQMEEVLTSVGGLTPREFMGIFPIEKTYDGKKYGCKDYFSTMLDSINANGIDKPIGEPFKFLMEYWNDDVSDFMVNMMMTMSRINRGKTGKGLFEQFVDEHSL